MRLSRTTRILTWAVCLGLAGLGLLRTTAPGLDRVQAQVGGLPSGPRTDRTATTRPPGMPLAPATPSPSFTPFVPVTPAAPPDARRGLTTFRERCAACHGTFGQGNGELLAQLPGRPPSFGDAGHMRSVTPAYAFDVVSHGRLARGMPPWDGSLDDQERWETVWGAWSFYLTPERLMRGRLAWAASCAGCHGDDGRGLPEVPLGDTAYRLTRNQTDLFTATRLAPSGHEDLQDLTDEALWSALDYAWTFVYQPLAHEALVPGAELAGRVVNGTAAASEVAGAVVRLVPLGDLFPGVPLTVTVGADGAFRFDDLASGGGARYGLVASFGGVDYIAPAVVDFEDGSAGPDRLRLQVFEPDPAAPIGIRTAHLALVPNPEAGLLRVNEVWVLHNDSDRARVPGAEGVTLRIPLPPGLTEVRLEDARMRAAARVDGDVLLDTLPVPPGEREVILSYDLPYEGSTARFEREMPLAAEELRVVVPGAGVMLDSPELPDQQERQFQGQVMAQRSGRDLAAGARVQVELAGLPPSSGVARNAGGVRPLVPSSLNQDRLALLGLLMALLGIGVVAAYPALLRRGTLGDPTQRLAAKRAGLVQEIADLDRRAAVGQIGDEAYARRRSVLLERAIAMARRQSGQEGGMT